MIWIVAFWVSNCAQPQTLSTFNSTWGEQAKKTRYLSFHPSKSFHLGSCLYPYFLTFRYYNLHHHITLANNILKYMNKTPYSFLVYMYIDLAISYYLFNTFVKGYSYIYMVRVRESEYTRFFLSSTRGAQCWPIGPNKQITLGVNPSEEGRYYYVVKSLCKHMWEVSNMCHPQGFLAYLACLHTWVIIPWFYLTT